MNSKLKQYQSVITDDDSAGSTLILLVMHVLARDLPDKLDILSWDPDTLKYEIKETFQVEISEVNFNKLMAAREVINSNAFWYDLPDFIMLSNALSGGMFDPRIFDVATMEEITWAVLESALLWPPDKSTQEAFSEEILAYIREIAAAEGLSRIPAVLKFAIPEDSPIWDQITAQFTDDPQMFDAIYKLSVEKTATIDAMLLERLEHMLKQMQAIELPEDTINLVLNVKELVEKYAVKAIE
jgi:hypothetical protein